jgi:hypothetical protein
MKTISFLLLTTLALPLAARAADCTAKVSGVHLCCKGCVTGVEDAVGKVPDAKAAVERSAIRYIKAIQD